MKITKNQIITEEVNRLNMNISEMAYAELGCDWRSDNAISSFTRVYYVTKGEGILEYGDIQIKLLPGNIYIIPAGFNYSYRCENYLEKLYFQINILRLNKYDFFLDVKECLILNGKEKEIAEMVELYKKKDVISALNVKTRLFNTVYEALHSAGVDLGVVEEYSAVTQNAINIIEESLNSNITVGDIADRLFISESKLHKQFKREIGVPIGKYINDRIMFIAERKLRLTDESIKDISLSLGFCDQFYFSRCFTEKYGISPLKYRKSFY